MDRSGQIELYFKSLVSEIKGFNFESLIKENSNNKNEDKSKKFINRLANLFELNNNNSTEIIKKVRAMCTKEEDVLLLRNFVDISKKFKEEKYSGKGLPNVYNEGHLQVAIENLKKEINAEQEQLKNSYNEISEEMKKIKTMSEEEKEKLMDKIDQEIISKKTMIDQFLSSHQEINSQDENCHDLPIYIFISKFKENFINPFCKKLSDFKQELI